jgi:GxxExxY protein
MLTTKPNEMRSFGRKNKAYKIALYIPYPIAFNSVIVDAKMIGHITDLERGRMLNYLRISKSRMNVILNFKHPKLERERIVL